MESSTNQRSIKVITVKTEAMKSKQELYEERWGAFWGWTVGSLFTVIVPAIGYQMLGQNPAGIFLAPASVGALAAAKTDKTKTLSRKYQLDGQPLSPFSLEREYRVMGLWDERTYILSGTKSSEWKLPEATTAEQAQLFFEKSQ